MCLLGIRHFIPRVGMRLKVSTYFLCKNTLFLSPFLHNICLPHGCKVTFTHQTNKVISDYVLYCEFQATSYAAFPFFHSSILTSILLLKKKKSWISTTASLQVEKFCLLHVGPLEGCCRSDISLPSVPLVLVFRFSQHLSESLAERERESLALLIFFFLFQPSVLSDCTNNVAYSPEDIHRYVQKRKGILLLLFFFFLLA